MPRPARTLKEVFQACDPTQALPAGDERYADLFPARGNQRDIIPQMFQRIDWSSPGESVVQTLVGHRGCGKSTELRCLRRKLEEDGYFVVFIDIEEEVDLEDPGITDVLLAILRQIEKQSREEGYEVSEERLRDIEEWFSEAVQSEERYRQIVAEVRSEAEGKAGIPLVASLMARFAGILKTGSTSKLEVRRVLDRQISQLLDQASLLVTAVRSALGRQKLKDLVVIVDALDRIPFKDLGDGRNTHEVLFLERGDLLRKIGCHTILTAPISLLYSSKHAIFKTIFPGNQILPMVKVVTPSGEPWEEGVRLLRELLARRIDLDTVVEPEAVDRLIEMSGGIPRDLIRMTQSASLLTQELPITLEAVERVIADERNDADRSIPDHHWPLLARVHRTHTNQNDQDHQRMLYNTSVLEYLNRDRWCEVHPVIRTLPRFQEALERYDASAEESSAESAEG